MINVTKFHQVCVLCCALLLLLASGCSQVTMEDNKKPSLISLLFTPDDLYAMLVHNRIDITRKNIISYNFTPKYSGYYSAGLIFPNYRKMFRRNMYNTLKLKLKIDFFIENKKIFSQITGEPILHFNSDSGSGLWLLQFNIPKQLPLHKEIDCKVEVLRPDLSFFEKHGDVKFYISKMSEK